MKIAFFDTKSYDKPSFDKFGKENGVSVLHGPWGFNDTDREGMLTFGFDKRATYATNYYYPYFCQNMQALGFNDESKWLEYDFTIPDTPYERITKIVEKLKNKLNVVDISDTLNIKQIRRKVV